jgi:anti-sigma regulatory factor (Ser/Thr protein kinase)
VIRLRQTIAVADASAVAAARRMALGCAEALQLGQTGAAKAALVATELATNVLKHAQGGLLILGDDGHALVLLSLDRGRGIANVRRAMEDGYSTAGSPGTGLGAISRNATQLDIYTFPEKGTAIYCQVEGQASAPVQRFQSAGINIPKTGEVECGDDWAIIEGPDHATILVADGLGHGELAAVASRTAVHTFAQRGTGELPLLFDELHAALRPTRGAAVGIARVLAAEGRVEFGGVGNIGGVILDEVTRRTVSHGGVVGHEMRKVQTFSYPWTPSSTLVLYSDGITNAWRLDDYPGLISRNPAMIAAMIYRDFCRGSDDATVVVVKK